MNAEEAFSPFSQGVSEETKVLIRPQSSSPSVLLLLLLPSDPFSFSFSFSYPFFFGRRRKNRPPHRFVPPPPSNAFLGLLRSTTTHPIASLDVNVSSVSNARCACCATFSTRRRRILSTLCFWSSSSKHRSRRVIRVFTSFYVDFKSREATDI